MLRSAGEYEVFSGPIRDTDGNVVVEKGDFLTLEEIIAMDFLMESLAGSMPE